MKADRILSAQEAGMKNSFKRVHKINLSLNGAADDFKQMHLDDKVSVILRKLAKDDFLIVSPDRETAMNRIKVLSALKGKLTGTIYHIKNEKFGEAAVFGYNSEKKCLDFINLNDEPIRVNTIPVKSYYGIKIKDGDRIWGSNMRSILIKSEPSVSAELGEKYALFADRYEPSEIAKISAEANYRPTTTNHIH